MQRRPEFSFQGSPARGLLPPRAPAPRYADEEEVRWLQASRQASPDYGSGTPLPQLWAYPASAGASPSRAQAIAGYRREMLDLVRGLPESAYELSLRDIVDHPAARPSSPPPPQPDPFLPPSNAAAPAAAQVSEEPAGAATAAEEGKKQSGVSGKKQGRKQRTMRKQRSRSRSLERSVSLDTGLLIKLFMPLSMGGRKKVSPRPDAAKDGKKNKDKDKEKKQGKKKNKETVAAPAVEQEEECWSKSEFSEAGGSSRTSSTGSSSNSNSSVGIIRNGHVNGGGCGNPRAQARSWSRKRTGCYAFFRANKNKNGVSQY